MKKATSYFFGRFFVVITLNQLGWGGLAMGLSTAAAAMESRSQISLGQAKEFAIKNNFSLRAKKFEMETLSAQRDQLGSAYYPTLGVATGLTANRFYTRADSGPIGYLYGNFNLFNGFRDLYSQQILDVRKEILHTELERAQWLLGLEIEELFHRYLFYKSLLGHKKRALELNEEHKRTVQRVRAQGLAADADVMEFEVKESLLQSEMVSLQENIEEARVDLKQLLGEEVGSTIEPMGELQHQHVAGTLASYIEVVNSQSHALKIASASQTEANLEARQWKASWLPKIDLESRYGYLPQDESQDRVRIGYDFLVVAKFDLFSGFKSLGEKREGLARVEQRQAEHRNAVLGTVTEVERSFRRLTAIQQRVDLEEKNESRIRRYYDSIMVGYRRGFKNSMDVASAADRYIDARVRLDEYKYHFIKQRIAMERALGGPVRVEVISEKRQ